MINMAVAPPSDHDGVVGWSFAASFVMGPCIPVIARGARRSMRHVYRESRDRASFASPSAVDRAPSRRL